MSGLRDTIRAWLTGPSTQPEPSEVVSGMFTYAADADRPGVITAVAPPEALPPGQRRVVRITLDEVLAARGVTGYLAGFRQRLSDDAERDGRPELARRAGYLGDVVFPAPDH